MPSFSSVPTVNLPQWLAGPLFSTINRLEFNFNPSLSIKRLRRYPFTLRGEGQYIFLGLVAIINLSYCVSPGLFGKLFIVTAYTLGLLIPFTSQFVLPATPIFSWLLLFWSTKFIPVSVRPHIWVSILPTLETVLYGANISDILTNVTNPILDILAWLPYGVLHFVFPFVAAALIWIFGPPGAVKFFAKVFGYMNLFGVMIQIFFPCAPPWYELIHGIMPADYTMKGSPGGLARIDTLFHGQGYNTTFTNSPVVFGAFPSLHAGCSTTDALLLNHFFPQYRVFYVVYVLWLYWSTMYLTHHYLVDLVAGAALAVAVFYFFLNEDPVMRDWALYASNNKGSNGSAGNGRAASNSFSFPNGSNGSMNGGGDVELGKPSGTAADYELPLNSSTGSTSAASEGGRSSTKDSSDLGVRQNPFLAAPAMGKESSRESEHGMARPRTPSYRGGTN